MPYTEDRPWGSFTILYDGPECKVKRLIVKPGQRLSYQLHHKRSEHWFIVSGEPVATINDEQLQLTPGMSVDIPTETKHRIGNPGQTEAVFIEVQTGTYFGEDDIIRLEDDYKRT